MGNGCGVRFRTSSIPLRSSHPPQKQQEEGVCCCRPQFFRASSLSHLLPKCHLKISRVARTFRGFHATSSKHHWRTSSSSFTFSPAVGVEEEAAEARPNVTTFSHERVFALALAKLLGGCDASFLLISVTLPICKLFGKCLHASFRRFLFVAALYHV